MRVKGDEGYILASALAVLLAISLVAAALVSASIDGMRRVQRLENQSRTEWTLRSALLLVISQLAADPRRRDLDFDGGKATSTVFGQQIEVRVAWESQKLDANRASPDAIDAALKNAGIDVERRLNVLLALQTPRIQGQPIRRLEDVVANADEWDCLHSILTVFGGRAEHEPTDQTGEIVIGRPAAGSRLAIDLWPADRPEQGIAVVVIMTDDPAEPAKILDWRDYRAQGRERCHAT